MLLEKTSKFAQMPVFVGNVLIYFTFFISPFNLIFCCLPLLSDSRVPLPGFIVNFGSTVCHQRFYLHLNNSLWPIPFLWVFLWVMGHSQALEITWIPGFLFWRSSCAPSAFAPTLRKCLLHYSLILPRPEQELRGRKGFLSSAVQWIHPLRGCFWQNSHLFVCHTVIFGSATTRYSCISREGLGLKQVTAKWKILEAAEVCVY